MSYENVLIVLIVALTIIVLAWLSNLLHIELDWDAENKLPKFKISFSRNQSQNTTSSSKQKSKNPAISLPYKVENVLGVAKISYGENAPSFMEKRFTIRATQNGVDSFYYHNNSNTEIRLVEGFSMETEFIKLRNFASWIGITGNSPFANLHRVTLPISAIDEDETRTVRIDAKMYAHYQELLDGMDLVSHGFFFRADAETYCADYIFEIPNGAVTDIFKIYVYHKDSEETMMKQEINLNEQQFALPNNFGHGWLRKLPDVTQVYWHIPQKLAPGQVCRLQWYTKRKTLEN